MKNPTLNRLTRLLRHLWLDADDAQRALGPTGLARLETQVGASERQHSAQICLCIEASLPLRYLWRNVAHGEAIEAVLRDRALTTFGKQRVWDTEDNNGVLVYLLLAEHRIEIVADRALARCTDEEHWLELGDRVAQACRAGHIEEGLTRAVDVVGAALAEHFPRATAHANIPADPGLADRPTIQ